MLNFFLRLGFGLFVFVALFNAAFGTLGLWRGEGPFFDNMKGFYWLSAASAGVAAVMRYLTRRLAAMR